MHNVIQGEKLVSVYCCMFVQLLLKTKLFEWSKSYNLIWPNHEHQMLPGKCLDFQCHRINNFIRSMLLLWYSQINSYSSYTDFFVCYCNGIINFQSTFDNIFRSTTFTQRITASALVENNVKIGSECANVQAFNLFQIMLNN